MTILLQFSQQKYSRQKSCIKNETLTVITHCTKLSIHGFDSYLTDFRHNCGILCGLFEVEFSSKSFIWKFPCNAVFITGKLLSRFYKLLGVDSVCS